MKIHLYMKNTSLLLLVFLSFFGTARGQVITTVATTSASPQSVCIDRSGNMYVADWGNQIWKVLSPSTFALVAGNGSFPDTGDLGPATAAQIYNPMSLATDRSGNIYIGEGTGKAIRRTSAGSINTMANNSYAWTSDDSVYLGSAYMSEVYGIAVDTSNNIFYTDVSRVRKIDSRGLITTVAGTIAASGYSYADGIPATNAMLGDIRAISVDRMGNLYISDISQAKIRKVSPSGIITTVAGNGTIGFSGDGGPATAAMISAGYGVVADQAGNIYFSDGANRRVRKISTSGIITTVAGTGAYSPLGDGGPASAATLYPLGLFIDSIGNIFVVDGMRAGIRKIDTCTHIPVVGPISGAHSFCTGSSITLSDTTAGGTWSVSSSSMAYITSSGVLTGLGVGTEIVTYTKTGVCNPVIQTVTINIDGPPSSSLTNIYGDSTVCAAGDTVHLSGGSGSGYSWSTSSASIASIGATTGILTGVSGGTVIVTLTFTNTCGSAYITRMERVSPLPAPGAISGPAAVCPGAPITLTDTPAGGSWSASTTGVATISSSGVLTAVSPGTVTISYSLTNSCGTTTVTRSISSGILPTAGSLTGASVVCEGATITLSPTVSGGSWSSSAAGVASVSTAGVVRGVSGGTATITYTVTNSCGSASTTRSVSVTPLPHPGTLSSAGGVCVGSSTTLTTSFGTGTWSSASPTVSVTSSGTATGVSTGMATITCVVSNSCGTDTGYLTVYVGTPPVAGSITGTLTACAGGGTTALVPSGGSSGGSWRSSDTSIATVSGGLVTGLTVGTVTISYIVTNPCGTRIATATVNIITLPAVAAITGADSVCPGMTIGLGDATAGGSWSSSATGIATVNAAGVVTGVSTGTSNISYTVTNDCGNTTVTHTIHVKPLSDCPSNVKDIATQGIGFTVYPNPTGGSYTLQLSQPLATEATVVVSDVLGRAVRTLTIPAGTTSTEDALLMPGVYLIRLQAGSMHQQLKLIVQ